jgi:hypothetical protein
MEEEEFKFFDQVRKHDFWYSMSDDHGVWEKGNNERIGIGLMLKSYPQLAWIWDGFCRAMDEGRRPLSLEELRRD